MKQSISIFENQKIGIFPGISNKAYHEGDGYSSSIVKLMGTPARARYAMDNPPEFKEHFSFGTAMHKWLFERDEFETEILTGISAGRRSKSDKEAWAQFYTEHGADGEEITSLKAAEWNGSFEKQTGKYMVTPDQLDQIKAMAEAVMANQNARTLLENGIAEQSIYWVDEETELHLKVRPDFMSQFCSDLKTCDNAESAIVSSNMYRYGYHVSQAMYSDGIFQVTGDHLPFLFIFVEKKPPYLSCVYRLDDTSAEIGWLEYRQYLRKLAECLETGNWPGIPDDLELSLPKWVLNNY